MRVGLLNLIIVGCFCKFEPDFLSPLDSGFIDVPGNPPVSSDSQQTEKTPTCELACLEEVTTTLKTLFIEGNLTDNMEKLCRRYDIAVNCMRPLTHCYDSMFPIITSGVRYMCEEQRKAFDVLIGCVDNTSPLVQRDCDNLCQPQSLVAGLAVSDTVMATLDQPVMNQAVNMRNIIEPHLGKLFFSEGCRISKCLLNCYKTKFNMLCEGTAGSLLLEMLSRPFSLMSSESSPLGAKFLSEVLGGLGLFPPTCNDLYSPNGGLRIDKELDKEIRRMYEHRKKITQEDIDSAGLPASNFNPFDTTRLDFEHFSPIERSMDTTDPLAGTASPNVVREHNSGKVRVWVEEEGSGMGSGEGPRLVLHEDTVLPVRAGYTYSFDIDDDGSGDGSGSGLELQGTQ